MPHIGFVRQFTTRDYLRASVAHSGPLRIPAGGPSPRLPAGELGSIGEANGLKAGVKLLLYRDLRPQHWLCFSHSFAGLFASQRRLAWPPARMGPFFEIELSKRP